MTYRSGTGHQINSDKGEAWMTIREQNRCDLQRPILCDQVYIFETGRTLSVQYSEHRQYLNNKTNYSAVATHAIDNYHNIDWENIILDHEDNFSLYRHKNFNQDVGLAVSLTWFTMMTSFICTILLFLVPVISLL